MRSGRGLHFTDTGGKGDAIVFIHGWGASGRFFEWVTARLPGRRCVAVDLPGFGRSKDLDDRYECEIPLMAELVHELAAELGVRPVVAGHSMGGMVAQEYAISYPAGLRGLVLIDTSPSPASERRWRLLVPMSPLMYPFGFKPAMRWFARTFAMNARTAPPEAVALMEAIAVDNRKRSLRGCIRGMRRWSALDRLAGIAAPALVIHGGADRMIYPSAMDHFRRALPRAEFHVLPGVGHSPTIEAPAETAALIGAFVAGLERDAGPGVSPSP